MRFPEQDAALLIRVQAAFPTCPAITQNAIHAFVVGEIKSCEFKIERLENEAENMQNALKPTWPGEAAPHE